MCMRRSVFHDYQLLVWLFCAAIVLSMPAMVFGEDLIVSGPTTISSPATYDIVIVQSGGTLTANAAITVLDDMTVNEGGVVTHSLRNEQGLILVVSGSIEIQVD